MAPAVAPVTATWFTLGCTTNDAVARAATGVAASDAGASSAVTSRTTPATGYRRRITGRRYPPSSAWHDHPVTKLAGAHVVITGGSSGIGLEAARVAAARGARVSLVARDPGRLATARGIADEVGDRVRRRHRSRGAAGCARAARRRAGAVRRVDHLGRLVAPGVLRAARRRRVPRPDGGRLLRHPPRRPCRRAVDDRTGPGASGDDLVDRGPHRGVRVHGVRPGEVRGAGPHRDPPPRARAPRDRGGVRLPARHPHAGLRRRERAEAPGDRAHLRRDQARATSHTWPGPS